MPPSKPSHRIERVAIDSLVRHPRNVRVGNVDAIASSLEAHGQYKPLIVQQSTKHILVGNHTWAAAQSLGWQKIDVVLVDVDDDEALRILLVDNRSTDGATYERAELTALLAELQHSELGLAGTGYEADDLSELLTSIASPAEMLTDPDDMPEPPPAKTVRGDVWVLGPHRVMCGDSTSPTDLDRLMNGKTANMVWTDPPYGISYQKDLSPEQAKILRRRTDGLSIQNDDLRGDALGQFLMQAFSSALSHCNDGAAWFVAAPPGGSEHIAFMQTLIDLGIYRQPIIWVKDSLVLGRSDYHYQHEPILYGWKPGAAHNAPPDRKQTTVWSIDRPKRSPDHPTMKPVALIERAISNHTKIGHLVLDPFGGSGSTLIAAQQSQRVAHLMELDPKYVDVICARYQAATGIVPIAESTGRHHDFTSGRS